MEPIEKEILEMLAKNEEGISLSYFLHHLSPTKEQGSDFTDVMLALEGLQRRKLIRFDDPIRGIENMEHFTSCTHVRAISSEKTNA
jgi:hypothetical protein